MKKFVIVILCMTFVLSISFINSKPVFNNYSDKFEICLYNSSSSGKLLTVSKNEFWKYTGIMGESFKTNKENFNMDNLLEDFNGKIVFTEKTDMGTSYYCKGKFRYYKRVKGEMINLHIFVGENQVTVGTPLIYGSF